MTTFVPSPSWPSSTAPTCTGHDNSDSCLATLMHLDYRTHWARRERAFPRKRVGQLRGCEESVGGMRVRAQRQSFGVAGALRSYFSHEYGAAPLRRWRITEVRLGCPGGAGRLPALRPAGVGADMRRSARAWILAVDVLQLRAHQGAEPATCMRWPGRPVVRTPAVAPGRVPRSQDLGLQPTPP